MTEARQIERPISASLLPEESRMGFLPAFFGPRLMIYAEALVYHWMTALSQDYNGGSWHYFTLSNRGFYMAPDIDQKLRVQVHGNFFDGELTADAAGIVATLFALGQLSTQTSEERVVLMHHLLQDFARQHEEWPLIRAALD